MGRFLDSLRKPSPLFEIEEGDGGFILVGSGDEFSDLIRETLDNAGEDYVALPVSDGSNGYERCVIITL